MGLTTEAASTGAGGTGRRAALGASAPRVPGARGRARAGPGGRTEPVCHVSGGPIEAGGAPAGPGQAGVPGRPRGGRHPLSPPGGPDSPRLGVAGAAGSSALPPACSGAPAGMEAPAGSEAPAGIPQGLPLEAASFLGSDWPRPRACKFGLCSRTAQAPATFCLPEPAVMLFELLSNCSPVSHMEKIETLIYLFVLQLALAASLLCSPGIPSHTLELKINSFYLGRASNGVLICSEYRSKARAERQQTGGEAAKASAWEGRGGGPWPSEAGQAQHGHSPVGTPTLRPGRGHPRSLDLRLPLVSSLWLRVSWKRRS